MDSFADLIAAMQSDLTVDGSSTLYDLPTIQLAINRAYRKCVGLFKWPMLEDALTTSSQANQEYYDYPKDSNGNSMWFPNSIWKLTVAGVDYGDPLTFKDYRFEIDNLEPSRLKQMWANQQLRYFIFPIPTISGSKDIVIWGEKIPPKLSSNGDYTIFSGVLPQCNEAILLEANAILKNKGELLQPVQRSFISGSLLLNAEAQNILTNAWNKIREEKGKYEKTQPFFDVPDMFGRFQNNVKNKIGDF